MTPRSIAAQHVQDYPPSIGDALITFAFKDPVRVATTAALAANTYSATAQTLTENSPGALAAVDGVTLVVGNYLLVKNEGTGSNNGIYVVTSLGGVSAKWVLTRVADASSSAQIASGLTVFVSEGTVNAGQLFVLTTANPITLDTTALTFTALGSGGTEVSGTPTAAGQILQATGAAAAAWTAPLFALLPCVAIAVTNQATMSGLAQTIDGVALSSAGMRVYLANQTTPAQNGIWVVQSGAWTRPADWATGNTPPLGTVVKIAPGGTSNWQAFGGEWMVTVTAVIDTGTVTAYPRVNKGQKALSSGTPSTGTVSSLWVLSATTSTVALTEVTNQANATLKGVLTADGGTPGSGSLAITGAATNTDTISYTVFNW